VGQYIHVGGELIKEGLQWRGLEKRARGIRLQNFKPLLRDKKNGS